ncbi:hypothetical protein [Agromyces bauzanensis]|uniref:hypothetical protein n=1 Tax=Agromyces bauzanensis TaxID=1308924 RepID=UPI00166E3E61|nr:hypothetical protein [Agromyces bauzanensis]
MDDTAHPSQDDGGVPQRRSANTNHHQVGEQSWFQWSAVAREAGLDRGAVTDWAEAVADGLPTLVTAAASSHLQTGDLPATGRTPDERELGRGHRDTLLGAHGQELGSP